MPRTRALVASPLRWAGLAAVATAAVRGIGGWLANVDVHATRQASFLLSVPFGLPATAIAVASTPQCQRPPEDAGRREATPNPRGQR